MDTNTLKEPFTLNEERCKRCGACAAVCPAGLVRQAGQQPPALDLQLLEWCIHCGHCSAVCPHGAWSSTGDEKTRWTDAASPTESLRLSVEGAIKSRRSVREFKDDPVPDALISSLIDAARYAPTAGNSQSVKWLVLNGKERVRRVAELTAEWFTTERDRMPPGPMKTRFDILSQQWAGGKDVICRGAPALVIVHADERHFAASLDCALALGNFDLLAWASGLGTCWAGFVQMATMGWPALEAHLALPPRHKVSGLMMLGFPRYRYLRIPERNRPAIEWRV
jgi:nitroreductase/ferredoxin